MKKNTKLYNMIMPIWMMFIFPFVWVVILPLNYIIDSLVFLITMKVLKLEHKKAMYKLSILKIWIFGFISDFIGATILFVPIIVNDVFNLDAGHKSGLIYSIVDKLMQVTVNPFDNIYAFILVTIAVLIAAVFIYVFNYKFSLKKAFENGYIDDVKRRKIALSMAIFTAPYLFYLPTMFMY